MSARYPSIIGSTDETEKIAREVAAQKQLNPFLWNTAPIYPKKAIAIC